MNQGSLTGLGTETPHEDLIGRPIQQGDRVFHPSISERRSDNKTVVIEFHEGFGYTGNIPLANIGGSVLVQKFDGTDVETNPEELPEHYREGFEAYFTTKIDCGSGESEGGFKVKPMNNLGAALETIGKGLLNQAPTAQEASERIKAVGNGFKSTKIADTEIEVSDSETWKPEKHGEARMIDGFKVTAYKRVAGGWFFHCFDDKIRRGWFGDSAERAISNTKDKYEAKATEKPKRKPKEKPIPEFKRIDDERPEEKVPVQEVVEEKTKEGNGQVENFDVFDL